MTAIYTIGFTKKPAEEFFTLLRGAGVRHLIDIRLNNQSQLAGFAKRKDLAFFTRELAGADYLYLPELAPTRELLDAFKKHGGPWEEYEVGFSRLMEERAAYARFDRRLLEEGTCFLCSEATPERCHRRLVAEGLRAMARNGLVIEHL